jgi:hypothetical protein
MSTVITPYPVLGDELLKKIGLEVVDYEFEYDDGKQTRKIETKPMRGEEHIASKFHLSDESEIWKPELHNLRFRRTIVIHNTRLLFGRDGIAPKDAVIGIAVKWMSKPSNQRGVFAGDSISFEDGKTQFVVQGELPPGILRDHFVLSTILYLKTRGKLQEGESHLANEPGVDLGTLDTVTIHLTGKGSYFPVFTISDDGPLWRVECNWDDPRYERFDEYSFRILLNANHPDYNHLNPSDKRVTPLMKEICLSALQILIEKVIEQVPVEELRSENYDRGSLCEAVRYHIEKFELDTSQKEHLAYTLRKKAYNRLGEVG